VIRLMEFIVQRRGRVMCPRTGHSLRSVAMAVAAVLVAACSPRSFPHQLPNTYGFSTDVTWQQAFRDHHIRIAPGAEGLRYSAYSQVDGYPVWAVFHSSCSAMPGFVANNHLTEVAGEASLPDGSVYDFAQQMGWRPSRPGSRWYQRPAGPRDDLEVLVAGAARICSVYLVGGTA
jgi:hypothetical protein